MNITRSAREPVRYLQRYPRLAGSDEVGNLALSSFRSYGINSALTAMGVAFPGVGLLVGLLISRLMSGQPNAGIGFELDAIAAVVLGGASIAGGRGVIVGTLLGAMLLGVLNNGLNMLGVSPYVQSVIKGAIILLAIFISRQRHK